jgi:hypothetical protein
LSSAEGSERAPCSSSGGGSASACATCCCRGAGKSGSPPGLAALWCCSSRPPGSAGEGGVCECWQLHALLLPLVLTLLSPAGGASLPLRLACPLGARGSGSSFRCAMRCESLPRAGPLSFPAAEDSGT